MLDYPKDNFEIIIVDNGSKDRTVEMIKTFQSKNSQIKLHFEKIKSSYAARNLGVKNAKGSIIAFTDIDCVINKEWLTNLVKGFSEDSIGGVAGDIIPENGDSVVERFSTKIGLLSQKMVLSAKYLPLPYAQTANVAYRKILFDQIGFFDDSLISGGDVDFSWRLMLHTEYNISYVSDAIVYHKHRTNLKDFYKQAFRYGYGKIFLYKKYESSVFNKIKEDTSVRIKGLGNDEIIDTNKSGVNDISLTLFQPLLKAIYFGGFNLGKIYARYKI